MFVHEDRDWKQLLEIIAAASNRDLGMLEKDYWVTHSLWALQAQGFELWFKGGTALSKGFSLIERFSEDLDLRIDAGQVILPELRLSWKNEKAGVAERDRWFEALTASLRIPGCEATRNALGSDDRVRSAWIEARYPGLYAHTLPGSMRPFVLLEVGRARVLPFVERSLSSWVHDHLQEEGQLADFFDNRPQAIRCVHPWVTCLEKLEAISRRFSIPGKSAADFVRHYEDVVHILAARLSLPPLSMTLAELLRELAREDHKKMPLPDHPAFHPDETSRWQEVQQAWQAIQPMFWGARIPLVEACEIIRSFLEELREIQ